MIAFVLVSLFAIAAISALFSLADSVVRGRRAYRELTEARFRRAEGDTRVTVTLGAVSNGAALPCAEIIRFSKPEANEQAMPLRAAA